MTSPTENQFFKTSTGRVVPPSGISYFLTLTGMDVDMIVKASGSDGKSKVLSSPILMTQDNKEATIKATELKYLYKGQKWSGASTDVGGQYVDDVDQKEVGLTVTVTPRINEKKMVVLTVKETFQEAIEEGQTINGTTWPSITSRELSADIAVQSGETVILGGLVRSKKGSSKSGIPILSSLPYIGWLFGTSTRSEDRSELLVFLTPYVLDNSKDLMDEAKRRRDYIDAKGMWTEGWSKSKLAEKTPELTQQARERAMKEAAGAARNTDPAAAQPRAGVLQSTTTTNLLEDVPLLR
jgi:general secretion pathway protein D